MQRSDIIQAAAQVIRKKGYHAASMQDIAEAVDLQKASLYHHVESKQEILITILDKALDLLIADLEEVVSAKLPIEEKLRQAMSVYIGRLTEEADLAAVLLLEYRSLEPKLRARHIKRRDRYETLWRQLLAEGMQSGALRPVHPAVATFALMGVMNWMITWYRPEGSIGALEFADQFADLFLRGMLAKEGTKIHGA
jgi:AcrR family transcriptional regulator